MDHPGLAVADEYRGKHIHLYLPQLCKGINFSLFSVPSNVAHNAAGGFRSFALQQNVTCLLQVICPLAAGGIVQTDTEIRLCRQIQTLCNGLPWCEQITQADDCKIMNQRRTQYRRTAAGCRNTRNHFNIQLWICFTYLMHQTCHAIHACITGADHGNRFTGQRCIPCPDTPVNLLLHRGL